MHSLRQYIELYRDNRDTIEAATAVIINRRRPAALRALEAFAEHPAPRTPYRETSADLLFAPDYGLNIGRLQFAVDLAASFRCDVPNISTLLAVVVNDTYRPGALLEKNLPAGVSVMSLARAAAEHPEWVEPYLDSLSACATPTAALNSLLLQDGVMVHISRGVRLDKPIQIVNIFNSPTAMLAVRRLLVVADEGASARLLLCDHSQGSGVPYLSCAVTEIFAGAGAEVEVYGIEEANADTVRVSETHARVADGARLLLNGSFLSGGISVNDYDVRLDGDNARADLSGLVIGGGSQCAANRVVLRHHGGRCVSRQLFKYALFDDARGEFGGKIVVDEGATGTDAEQNNRNLLVSDGARMDSAPQLEIYCDDVRCGHGSATGELDANALFYMRQRGIPLDEARMMLTQAFMSDVVDAVGYEPVRDRLRHLVEKRLGGEAASCANCSAEDSLCNR